MFVNPVFSKSGKGLNSFKKKIKQKNRSKIKVLQKKPKLQTCLKGGKIAVWTWAKKKPRQIKSVEFIL